MILVVGATGMLGGEISRLLAEKGRPVRALVRPSSAKEAVKALSALGVETVEGDVRDQASLARACKGMDAVICTVSSMPTRYQPGSNDIASVDRDGVKRLIDAAKEAGVGHFVYTSFTMEESFPLRDAKRAVEGYLRESGMSYTILRPSYFMEAWLSPMVGFDYEKAMARIFGSGERPVSFVSFKDVARFAVASLENPAAKNAVLRIGGAEPVSPHKVVTVFEEIGGRKFSIEEVPESALAAQQKEATDPMQQSFSGLMRGLALGDAVDMSGLAKEFGIHLKSVRDYAREVLS